MASTAIAEDWAKAIRVSFFQEAINCLLDQGNVTGAMEIWEAYPECRLVDYAELAYCESFNGKYRIDGTVTLYLSPWRTYGRLGLDAEAIKNIASKIHSNAISDNTKVRLTMELIRGLLADIPMAKKE